VHLESTVVQAQALRIVFAVAMGACALLTPTLAAKLTPQTAELRTSAAPGPSLMLMQVSASPTNYRPDAPDTGPPSPGPTDPNTPWS